MPKFEIERTVSYYRTVEADTYEDAREMAEELTTWTCDDERVHICATQVDPVPDGPDA